MRATIILALALTAAAGGCTPNYITPIVQPREMSVSERNFEALWQASLTTLRSNYFYIDRQDRRAGVITTHPMTGSQWFEFWRHDSITKYDVEESSLQTIYRIAEVDIAPAKGGGDTFAATVKVTKLRADRKTRQIANTMDAFDLFAMAGESYFDQRRAKNYLNYGPSTMRPTEESPWVVPLGRDSRFEARLLDEINSGSYQQVVEKK